MSLTIPFTGRRDRRKHSPDTIIRNLRDENVKLLNRQAEADNYFAILLGDVTTTNAGWEQETRRRAEAEADRDWWRDEAERLRAELAPYKAAEANANRVDVPPMVRRVDGPEDEATAPIDVRPLWEAFNAPCPECLTPVPAGTTYCSARCRNAADRHDDLPGGED